jgi:hypothetical protein
MQGYVRLEKVRSYLFILCLFRPGKVKYILVRAGYFLLGQVKTG